MTASEANALGRGRMTAAIIGLLAACAMLLGLGAKQADAAVVGNPGTFTATWTGGAMQYGNQSFTPSGSFTMNVAADGTFTASGITFPGKSAPDVVNGNVQLQQVTLTPQATGTWTGSINPDTGEVSLSGPLQIHLYSNRSGYIGVVTNTSSTTCVGSTAVNVNPSGSNYDWTSGTVSLSYGPFTGGGANDCRARSGIVGGSTANQDGPVNSAYGMNGSSNSINTGLSISPAILPPNIVPDLKAIPSVAAIDQSVTLSAADSKILPTSGVELCAAPSPSEPNCGYRWDFDNDGTVDEVTNDPTTSHVFGADGTYNPKVTIYDTSGLSYDASTTVTTQTRPVAQIDTTPSNPTGQTANQFTFSIPSNPYSATTECSIDGGTFTACESGDTFNFSRADDTVGSHNFRVRGITPGGVTGPPASHDFTIDRVKPRVTIAPASRPADPTNVNSAAFTFTADKPGSTLECQLDGGSWQACGTNSSGSQSYNGLGETPNPHEFRIRATDPLGNVGGDGNPGGGAYDWEVDTTPPVIDLDTKPAQPSNDESPAFGWTNNEPIQIAQCRLGYNGTLGAWQNCDSLTGTQYHELLNGNFSFAVRTLDLAGNWSSTVTHNWLLETVNPGLHIRSTPPEFSKRSLAQFFFEADSDTTTKCQLDSRPVQDPCASGVKYAYLAEGAHTFTVTATDPALNETTRTYAWSVKTIQPVVAINPGSVPEASSTVDSADFEFATANGDAECRLDGGSWTACDSNAGQAYTDLDQGNHTFEVRAVDQYGNESAIDAYSWLVVTDAPQVTLDSTPAAKERHTTATFGFTVESADRNVPTVCSVDGIEFDCSDPAVATGLADGEHTFEVIATDSAGAQGSASYDWTVKAKIPGLGFDATPAAISNSNAATFEFSSDEDPDVAYECSLDGADWTDCETPVELTSLSQGNHQFRIRATDDVDNSIVESYSWKVDTIAPTVSFDQKPAATTEDVAELIKFTASESDVAFSCKLDGAAFASCTSPALLKALALGDHTFSVKATDAAGNEGAVASASWKIKAPEAPVVQKGPSPAPQSGSNASAPAQVQTQATCPASLGGACKVTVVALAKKGGASVSKSKTIKVGKGKSKTVRLVRTKGKAAKVVVKQKIKAKGKKRVIYRKASVRSAE